MLTLNLEPHFEFGKKKSESEENNPPAPDDNGTDAEVVCPVSSGSTAAAIDLSQLLMVGVVIAILILSSAVLVYAARH